MTDGVAAGGCGAVSAARIRAVPAHSVGVGWGDGDGDPATAQINTDGRGQADVDDVDLVSEGAGKIVGSVHHAQLIVSNSRGG